MKKITRYEVTKEEKKVFIDVLSDKMSLREASKLLGCSYEQVRLLCGKLFIAGLNNGSIKVNWDDLFEESKI